MMWWLENLAKLLLIIFIAPFVSALLESRWVQSAFFLFIGFIFVLLLVQLTRSNRLLRRSGENVPAIVTSKDTYRSGGRRGSRKYKIYLEYRLPSSETIYSVNTTVSKSVYDPIRTGDTINIIVATEDPSVFSLGQSYSPSYYLYFILIGLSLVFFWDRPISIGF